MENSNPSFLEVVGAGALVLLAGLLVFSARPSRHQPSQDPAAEIDLLQSQLREAVTEQDFLQAAKLRDLINAKQLHYDR